MAEPAAERIIVIARTKAEAARYVEQFELPKPVAVVTIRSPYAARGTIADVWYMTPEVAGHKWIADLVDEVTPALATTGGTRRG